MQNGNGTRIGINEVATRDGFQMEPVFIPEARRPDLIRLLLETMPVRVFFVCSMDRALHRPNGPAVAPSAFRDALAELVQIGLSVARMVGRVAEAETALAEAASQARVAEGVSALAGSLAEAIEADRAAAAAAEMRQTVVARTEAVAGAFARVSRSVRLTVLLAERLDRGWAWPGEADGRHAKMLGQIARGVADAVGRETESERAVRLTGALTERLEALDTEAGIGDRSAEEIIGEICRGLGLDPARMIVRLPFRDAAIVGEADPLMGDGRTWAVPPPQQRRPDG